MVGHDVQDLPHAALPQGIDHGLIILRVAKFRIQRAVIDNRVAMLTAGASLCAGGSVEMADAQFVQVVGQFRRVAKGHVLVVELQSVRRVGRFGPDRDLALQGFHRALHQLGEIAHVRHRL